MESIRLLRVLYEIIRDLPEAQRMSDKFENGQLSIEDCLEEIAYVIRRERQ